MLADPARASTAILRDASVTVLESKRMRTSKITHLLLLFIASLSIRVLGIHLETIFGIGGHVAFRYTDIARNIVAGNGFSDAPGLANTFEPPVYMYLLSAFFTLFGENLTVVKIGQAVLDSLTACTLFFITRTALSVNAAYLAAILYALYPIAVYSVADIAPETTFSFLLSLALLTLALALRSGHVRHYLASGLLLGCATLTRTTTLYFVPFLVLFLVVVRAGRKRVVPLVLVTLSAFVLTIAPWTVRNYVVSKRFIPVAVMGYGEVFLQGSSEEFLTIADKQQNFPAYFERLRAKNLAPPVHPTPKEWNDYATRAGWERYKEKWEDGGILSLAKFFAYKFARLWYATESGANHPLILLVNLPVLLLSLMGLIVAIRSRIPPDAQWPIWAVVLFFIAVHIVTLPMQRYMAPVMPYLLAYAALFLTWLASQRQARRAHREVG